MLHLRIAFTGRTNGQSIVAFTQAILCRTSGSTERHSTAVQHLSLQNPNTVVVQRMAVSFELKRSDVSDERKTKWTLQM